MKCPACLSEEYQYEGFCGACGFVGHRTGADLDLARHLGVEIINGVKKIVPLTKALVKKGRVIFQRKEVAQ